MMKINQKMNDIFVFLDKYYPDAKCGLIYSKDYELLIAVMLSAQTTDVSVNKVTAVLFNKYPTLEALDNASFEDIKKCIASIGLANNKAHNIKGITHLLLTKFDGKVPNNEQDLLSLPGVGNKTKNCIESEIFNVPMLAVDTHVQRISKRLKLVKDNDSVELMEKKLLKLIPKERLIKTNHQIIWFGRTICKAKNPNCKQCELQKYCKNYLK